MSRISMIKKISIFLLLLLLTGCENSKIDSVMDNTAEYTQNLIVGGYDLNQLNDETYFFPATNDANETVYIPLQKWDIIFAGFRIDSNDSTQIISMLSPGKYTHALIYLGKDSNGYAYATEMNAFPDATLKVDFAGVYVDGNLFIDCLGSDYEKSNCPLSDYGSEKLFSHDYLIAKRFSMDIREKISQNEEKILQVIAEDAQDYYPYQAPLLINYETSQTKEIILTDDGWTNGSYCAEYVVLLLEEAGVCLEDVHMTPEELYDYFVYNSPGKDYILPAEFNIESGEAITTQDFFLTYGYTFVNGPARASVCYDGGEPHGVVTPEFIHNSPSMEDIPTIDERQ